MSEAANRIARYTAGMTREEFARDEMTRDAVLRNLAIIGEAAKNVPEDVRIRHPAIEWRRIAGFRDIVVHAYFGIDDAILTEIVFSKVPELTAAIGDISKSKHPKQQP